MKKLFIFALLALFCSGCSGLSIPVNQILPFFLIDQRNFSPSGEKDDCLKETPSLDFPSTTPLFLVNDFPFPQQPNRYGPLRYSMEESHPDNV
ncbi:MAG: hypothetical protein AB1656_24035 [Candidatus Omnitrophota bacterium]